MNMNLRPSKSNMWHNSRFRIAGALIIGALLLAALALRLGSIVQAIRLDAFSVEMARAVAGPENRVPGPVDSSLDLPETERLSGMLALKVGDIAGSDSYFEKAIEGNVSMVPLVRDARPQDETLARLAYKLYPSIPDSPAWLADVLAKTEPEEALMLYKEAVGLDPLNNLLWEQVGLVAQSLGHNDIALDALGKACDLNPQRTTPCIFAARLSYAAGNWDRVIYYFVRGSLPGTYADWVLMIKAAQKLGRTADANAYLVQAQEAIPADYNTLLAKQK
jgi:tetratricopeptide (TPR) repeat protein